MFFCRESLAPLLLLQFSLFLRQSSFYFVESGNGYISPVFCVEFVYRLGWCRLGLEFLARLAFFVQSQATLSSLAVSIDYWK